MIRKIQGEERVRASIISCVAFHDHIDDLAAEREKILAREGESNDWGIFTEDGKLMTHIINNKFRVNFDGHTIQMGGIGAVSTMPEYRGQGDVRGLFEKILPDSLERGDILSSLYPFNHGFYRKFGYETANIWQEFRIPTQDLRRYRHNGTAVLWEEGDDIAPFLAVYKKFAANFNMAFDRDLENMKRHIHGTYYKDRYFVYLLGDSEGPSAYVAYQDVRKGSESTLQVKDFAFDGRRGYQALLGFLGRFSADYEEVEFIRFPTNLYLPDFAGNPYETGRTPSVEHMVRAINVPALLSLMKKPAGAVFTLEVFGDEFIPQNNGKWQISGEEVIPFTGEADISMDEHTFSQLVVGASNLFEASLRPDVTIRGNEELLQQIFVNKPRYIADYF